MRARTVPSTAARERTAAGGANLAPPPRGKTNTVKEVEVAWEIALSTYGADQWDCKRGDWSEISEACEAQSEASILDEPSHHPPGL